MDERSSRPFSKRLRLAPKELAKEKSKELLKAKSKELASQLGRLYLRMARVEPEAASPREIRELRRSEWAPLRAAGVLLWSQRSPTAFLRAAPKVFGDEAPEVREAVLEGLVCAAERRGLKGDAQRKARDLLALASRDESAAVREASEDTAALLGL